MRLQEYVETKAYFRWLNRGADHGNDLADWLEAERHTPDRIWMAWKPSPTDKGWDYNNLVPSLANWEELFAQSRHVPTNDRIQRVFFTRAWLDERDLAHTNGDVPGDCPCSSPPYPFPDPEELDARGVTIAFHGMVLIRWVVTLLHGNTESMTACIVRHPDTCWEMIPRVHEGFRHPAFKVYGFPKRVPWRDCVYNREH